MVISKFNKVLEKHRARIVNWVIIILVLSISFDLSFWRQDKKIIYWDALHYYSYLPATFIYHDLTLDFVKKDPEKYKTKFWPKPTSIDKMVIKTSMGLSFLYAPFFFLGHLFAKISSYSANGFTLPYKFALAMSVIFYLGFGLYYLRKLLKLYFSEWITALTCFAIVVGTNLLHYTTSEPTMSHAYSFSLIAAFMYFTIKWYEDPDFKNTLILGLLLGLICLIRPTNGIIIIFFLVWKIHSINDLTTRIVFLSKKYKMILLMILGFFIVWVPQIIYWKYVTGQYFYFSYGDEGFYFNDPQIIKGLFSYRKGWLLYTPLMVLALAGIPLLWRKQKELFTPVLIFTILNIYLILSWWAWWYGGGYGLRAFIDSYAIMAIPLAAFITWSSEKKILIKILTLAVVFILIGHNLFQTKQYYNEAIHWDSMSKEAYWESFGRLHATDKFHNLLDPPNYVGEKYRSNNKENK